MAKTRKLDLTKPPQDFAHFGRYVYDELKRANANRNGETLPMSRLFSIVHAGLDSSRNIFELPAEALSEGPLVTSNDQGDDGEEFDGYAYLRANGMI